MITLAPRVLVHAVQQARQGQHLHANNEHFFPRDVEGILKHALEVIPAMG